MRHTVRRRDPGFTLVEILIAIVLVGILSAVVVVGVGSLTSKGSAASCAASLDATRTAVSAHTVSTGAAHSTIGDMVTSGALVVPSGVTLDATGTQLTGTGWTLLGVGYGGSTPTPTFTCIDTSAARLWTPADLPSLALWLDGSDPASVTQVGGTVTRWNDKSGNGRDVTQATVASRATYANGSVRFDGVDDALAGTAPLPAGATSFSMTAVFSPSRLAGNTFEYVINQAGPLTGGIVASLAVYFARLAYSGQSNDATYPALPAMSIGPRYTGPSPRCPARRPHSTAGPRTGDTNSGTTQFRLADPFSG